MPVPPIDTSAEDDREERGQGKARSWRGRMRRDIAPAGAGRARELIQLTAEIPIRSSRAAWPRRRSYGTLRAPMPCCGADGVADVGREIGCQREASAIGAEDLAAREVVEHPRARGDRRAREHAIDEASLSSSVESQIGFTWCIGVIGFCSFAISVLAMVFPWKGTSPVSS